MELSDAKRMKEADREAIEGRGISSLLLMERASALVGQAAALLAGVPPEELEGDMPPEAEKSPEPEPEPEPTEPESPAPVQKKSLWRRLFCPPDPPAPVPVEEPSKEENTAEDVQPAPEESAVEPSAQVEIPEGTRRAVIFSGPGNNGGDGIGAAVYLQKRGFYVRAFLVGERGKMTPDSLAMEQRLTEAGGALEPFVPGDEDIEATVREADVLIDALFGVGLSRPLTGDALEAVRLMNRSGRPVVSADIASGVSADTGAILGEAVRAACTVTFSMAKPGHFIEPGSECAGRVQVEDIGIPQDILGQAVCGIRAIRPGDLRLPKRAPLTHKGDYGKLLVVGGCVGYTGAPTLCARAAVIAGVGLVYLGVPADIYEVTAMKNDEAMPFPLACDNRGRISPQALPLIEERLTKCNVCVIGPGLGRGEGTAAVVAEVLRRTEIPVVADADALWAIGRDLSLLDEARAPVVLTPHEGEFARLLGRAVNDRLTDAMDFSRAHHCAVVLKGHRTICTFPDGQGAVIVAGNPGMASGGTGDVLAGIIGGLMGQMTPRQAVVTACWLHARAGDLAAAERGEYAVTAGSILELLPAVEKEMTEQ
ncbi:MAG: NAD(P)H-hydrate dehydratase [Oscillospiraceae bacterium]|nr:NAD(P)H-hydrate dehydratase [Oscillospiraceae bacterium]